MNNVSGRLNRKIELWQHVQTEEKNSIGQKKWEETTFGKKSLKI